MHECKNHSVATKQTKVSRPTRERKIIDVPDVLWRRIRIRALQAGKGVSEFVCSLLEKAA